MKKKREKKNIFVFAYVGLRGMRFRIQKSELSKRRYTFLQILSKLKCRTRGGHIIHQITPPR